MTNFNEYFSYLQNRSQLGLFYRKWLLYPKINKNLPGKTLDIGCGIGDFLSYRKDANGTDINPKLVEWCQSLGMNVTQMNVDELPFESGSYDSILLDNVLEHIVDPAPLLKEINRTLSSNGILVVGVPGKAGYACDADHKVFYSKDKLIETVEQYGFNKSSLFAMPLDIGWLENKLTQYCVYGVFQKIR